MERRDRDFSLLDRGKGGGPEQGPLWSYTQPPTQAQPNTCSQDHCTHLFSLTHILSSLRGCGAFEKCRDKIPEAMLIQCLGGCHS